MKFFKQKKTKYEYYFITYHWNEYILSNSHTSWSNIIYEYYYRGSF